MLKLVFVLFFLSKVIHCQVQKECESRDYGNGGTVCVCTSNNCDTIPRPEKIQKPKYLIYTSNKAGLRFGKKIAEFNSSSPRLRHVTVNSEGKYQTVIGWGGAFTDSTGININSLPEDLQDKLLRSYFSDEGIEYNLGRVPMASTDFSTRAYSYDDVNGDKNLTNFALVEEDYKYKIPYIKKAKQLTNDNLQLFASAWAAPKWMKTNRQYTGFGFLKKEMYQPWANYFVKFLDEYRKMGLDFWGLTTGNEPMTVWIPRQGNKISDVGWLPWDLGNWIENNLGPTVRSSNHSDIKIMAFDDNRIYLPLYVDIALKNETARNFVDGIAVHWYTDSLPAFPLTITHQQFPDKFILATEASFGSFSSHPVLLGSWERGESYSSDIIQDMNHWVGGWVDWNMVLDLKGGPSYFNNRLDAAIITNVTAEEFYKQPMFYHMGHFSKFIPRGSVRIDTRSSLILTSTSNVKVVAFQRPDNSTAVVILNKGNSVVKMSLVDKSRGTAELELSGKSINTILYW